MATGLDSLNRVSSSIPDSTAGHARLARSVRHRNRWRCNLDLDGREN